MQDNSYFGGNDMLKKKHRTIGLDKSLKNLENQNQDLSRHLDVLRNQRSRLEERNQSKFNQSMGNLNEYELEKMKQEYYTVKSDNILYKEEVNLLYEKNQKLEQDLANQYNRK